MCDFLDSQYRWIAIGKTYPHREVLQGWGWFYIGHKVDNKSTYAADHITSTDDPDLKAIEALEGVKVQRTEQEV